MKTLSLHRNLLNFGVPLSLFTVLIWLMKSPFAREHEVMSLAITIDLILVVPLVYFLLIRKSAIPNTTAIPVMVAGLVIGSFFLPPSGQAYLNLFKTWGLPVLEITILATIVIKVRKAVKTYKANKNASADFYDALKTTCATVLPKPLVLPFATEVAVFYYGFLLWRKRELKSQEFTYHKTSGTPALLSAFIFIIAVETVALHVLLQNWSPIFAWVLTALSVYTGIQVFGFTRALFKRPVSIEGNTLHLRYGILNETHISINDIKEAVLTQKEIEKHPLTATLSPLGALESQNVVITLKNEYTLTGLYGAKKKFRVIALYIDEPASFKRTLEDLM